MEKKRKKEKTKMGIVSCEFDFRGDGRNYGFGRKTAFKPGTRTSTRIGSGQRACYIQVRDLDSSRSLGSRPSLRPGHLYTI